MFCLDVNHFNLKKGNEWRNTWNALNKLMFFIVEAKKGNIHSNPSSEVDFIMKNSSYNFCFHKLWVLQSCLRHL